MLEVPSMRTFTFPGFESSRVMPSAATKELTADSDRVISVTRRFRVFISNLQKAARSGVIAGHKIGPGAHATPTARRSSDFRVKRSYFAAAAEAAGRCHTTHSKKIFTLSSVLISNPRPVGEGGLMPK